VILTLLIGGALLLIGRCLFWLCVAATGLVVGMMVAPSIGVQSEVLRVIVVVALGILGALAAIVLPRVAVGAAGFLAGGQIAVAILHSMGLATDRASWLPFLVAGVVGAVLVAALFDWALILLSTMLGATLVVQQIPVDPALQAFLFVGLVITGVLTQAHQLRRSTARRRF